MRNAETSGRGSFAATVFRTLIPPSLIVLVWLFLPVDIAVEWVLLAALPLCLLLGRCFDPVTEFLCVLCTLFFFFSDPPPCAPPRAQFAPLSVLSAALQVQGSPCRVLYVGSAPEYPEWLDALPGNANVFAILPPESLSEDWRYVQCLKSYFPLAELEELQMPPFQLILFNLPPDLPAPLRKRFFRAAAKHLDQEQHGVILADASFVTQGFSPLRREFLTPNLAAFRTIPLERSSEALVLRLEELDSDSPIPPCMFPVLKSLEVVEPELSVPPNPYSRTGIFFAAYLVFRLFAGRYPRGARSCAKLEIGLAATLFFLACTHMMANSQLQLGVDPFLILPLAVLICRPGPRAVEWLFPLAVFLFLGMSFFFSVPECISLLFFMGIWGAGAFWSQSGGGGKIWGLLGAFGGIAVAFWSPDPLFLGALALAVILPRFVRL